MSALGHQRRFEDALATSEMRLTADTRLHCVADPSVEA